MPAELSSADALLVVDVQRDFCPGGPLPVRDCAGPVRELNAWIAAARAGGAAIVASRDWHPPGHTSFEEQGGEWPPHCLQDTPGAEFHPDLELPPDTPVVSKGAAVDRDSYSAFDGTGLADRLREGGVQRIWVGGLARDVCVKATVLDGLEAGFETHLVLPATSPVDEAGGRKAVEEMRSAGAIVEE